MEGGSYKGLCPTDRADASEERTSSPVAGVGFDAFRLMAENAVDQGWIKPESLKHIMAAYSQVVR